MPNFRHHGNHLNGEMPERLNGPVSKTGVGQLHRGFKSLSPPKFNHLHIIKSVTKITLGITWNIFLEYFQVTGHQVLVKL